MKPYSNHPGNSPNRYAAPYKRRQNSGGGFFPILLFYILPFLAVNGLIFFLVTIRPKAQVTISESGDYISSRMELKIKSLLPLQSVEVSLDGVPLESLKKTGSKSYDATLTSNGMLEIKLTSVNKMKAIVYEAVDVLDDTPPTVSDSQIEGGVLSFHLEDSQSGVDFTSITATDENNEDFLPLTVNRITGIVTFQMGEINLTITARDKIGNELHTTFDPQGEGIEEETPEAF